MFELKGHPIGTFFRKQLFRKQLPDQKRYIRLDLIRQKFKRNTSGSCGG
jgi:hypothetical protein